MGGGVMSTVAKFTATGIRGIVPPLQSSVQSISEVSPAENKSSVAFQAFQLLSESSEAQVVLYKCIVLRVFINLYASLMK